MMFCTSKITMKMSCKGAFRLPTSLIFSTSTFEFSEVKIERKRFTYVATVVLFLLEGNHQGEETFHPTRPYTKCYIFYDLCQGLEAIISKKI